MSSFNPLLGQLIYQSVKVPYDLEAGQASRSCPQEILLLLQPDSFTDLARFVSDEANGSCLRLGTNAAHLLSMLNEQSL
jgi:hypothetical protein